MYARLELAHILPNTGASDTGVALDSHVVTQGHDNLLDLLGQLTGGGQNQSPAVPGVDINTLKNRDGEGCCLTSS